MHEDGPFGSVPGVAITVLLDNLSDMLARSTDTVKRFSDGPLIAEHGFSALIELPAAGLQILWDAGGTPTAVMDNLRRMKIDPTTIDIIALSHGHWDHVAGLSDVLRAISAAPEAKLFPAGVGDQELVSYAKRKTVPLIVHPAAFRERWSFLEDGRRYGPRNPTDRAAWEALGAEIRESTMPHRIADGCWATGYVPRESFEAGTPSVSRRFRDGDRFEIDDIDDDQSIVIHVEGKGLVVVAGCAHAGIVNTVRHARKISGIDRVYAILGGFHLGRVTDRTIEQTVETIAEMEPAVIVPSHCTGFAAMRRFAERMPDAFVLGTVGTTYSF